MSDAIHGGQVDEHHLRLMVAQDRFGLRGNLAPEVDEKMLYDTFSAFGPLAQQPKVMRDLDSGASKGFGFVSFDSFEASDAAIEAMNGQFLCNRPITVMCVPCARSPCSFTTPDELLMPTGTRTRRTPGERGTAPRRNGCCANMSPRYARAMAIASSRGMWSMKLSTPLTCPL